MSRAGHVRLVYLCPPWAKTRILGFSGMVCSRQGAHRQACRESSSCVILCAVAVTLVCVLGATLEAVRMRVLTLAQTSV